MNIWLGLLIALPVWLAIGWVCWWSYRPTKVVKPVEFFPNEPELETYIPQHILDMMDKVNIDFDDYVDRMCENPPVHLYALQYKPTVYLYKPSTGRQRPGNDPRELELRQALKETKWG